jgi:hypothetical protein
VCGIDAKHLAQDAFAQHARRFLIARKTSFAASYKSLASPVSTPANYRVLRRSE